MIFSVVVICLLVSGLFSGIEAGILSVNIVRLKHRVKKRDSAAVKLDMLLSHPERLLVTVLLVTNFMNICAIALCTREFVQRMGPAGYGVAFIVWLPIYVGMELLPKSIFRRIPFRSLAAFSELLRITDILLSPLLALGSIIYHTLAPKRDRDFKKLFIAREDFRFLTSESERVGSLTRIEREMIHNVIDFRGVRTREIMSPIAGFHLITVNDSVQKLAQISRSTQFDWFPFATETGEVTGQINVMEFLLDSEKPGIKVSAYARRIITADPDEPAFGLIYKLRTAQCNLAAVRDMNGRTVGLVSSEQLTRRLVSKSL